MNKKYLITTLIICLIGFILSFLLAQVGINTLTNPDYHSFCNINEGFNCETVALSSYANHFGIPNFIYGLFYYAVLLLAGCFCLVDKKNRLPNYFVYVFWLSTFSILVSIYLFSISIFIIKSKCILCIMVYVVNILLLVVSFMTEKSSIPILFNKLISDIKTYFKTPQRTILFIVLAIIGVCTLFYFNANPILGQSKETNPNLDNIKIDYSTTSVDRLVTGPEETPTITIIEFTDYECPFCSKASEEIKKVLKNNPNIRLIFKEYPLDQACNDRMTRPFHKNSCSASLHARCAAEQGKFWEYHDIIFMNQQDLSPNALEEYADSLKLDMKAFNECVKSNRHMDKIITNIDEAAALGIDGTPTFFIDGEKIVGYRTAEEFQEEIDKVLEKKKKAAEEYEKRKQEFLKKQVEMQKEKAKNSQQKENSDNKQEENTVKTNDKHSE